MNTPYNIHLKKNVVHCVTIQQEVNLIGPANAGVVFISLKKFLSFEDPKIKCLNS